MRMFRILFMLFCAALFAASCSRRSPQGPSVTITYYARATTDQLPIWEKVMKNFMKENPLIKVKIENVPYSEYWSKLLTMSAAGVSPDVVFMESTRLPAFVEKESILCLDGFLAKDRSVNLKEFYPVSIDISKYKGGLYGLPNDLAIVALYYNRDMFDQAGVPYPKAGWTWEDLVRKGKMLTKDKNGDGAADQYGITHYDWQIAIYQNGGDLVDDPADPKRSTLNTPAVHEALNFCRDLGFRHKISPPAQQQQYRSVYEMFTSGYAAMTMDGHWMVPAYRNIKNFKWDTVVLPRAKRSAGVAYGSFYSIPKMSKNPEAAWKLIKYLAGAKGQEVLVADGFSVPALKAVANSGIFLSPPPDNQKAFLDMIKVGRPKPQTGYFMEIEDTWRTRMDDFWLGKRTASRVTAEIDARVNRILKGGK